MAYILMKSVVINNNIRLYENKNIMYDNMIILLIQFLNK